MIIPMSKLENMIGFSNFIIIEALLIIKLTNLILYYLQSIYETQIELSGMPLLDWDPPPLSSNIYAKDLMTRPVISFMTVETVGNIVQILKKYSHNGFPVIEYVNSCELVSELNDINLLISILS